MSEPTDTFNISNLMGFAVSFVAMTITNLAITLFVLDYTGNLNRGEVVSVDSADLVREFVAALPADISEADLAASMRALNDEVDPLLQAMAFERNLIIVDAASALGGVRDITPDLLAILGVN